MNVCDLRNSPFGVATHLDVMPENQEDGGAIMASLFEIEDQVIDRLSKTKHKGRVSKYEALIKSAVSTNAMSCDGLIMMEAQSIIETALNDLSNQDLIAVYNESEAGQEASTQDLEPVCRESMTHDVLVEILQRIGETVCSEARERMSRK